MLPVNWIQKDLGPRPGKWLKLPECWPSIHGTEPGVAKMPWVDKAQCGHGVSTQPTRAQSEVKGDMREEVSTRAEFRHYGWSERTQFCQDILLHPVSLPGVLPACQGPYSGPGVLPVCLHLPTLPITSLLQAKICNLSPLPGVPSHPWSYSPLTLQQGPMSPLPDTWPLLLPGAQMTCSSRHPIEINSVSLGLTLDTNPQATAVSLSKIPSLLSGHILKRWERAPFLLSFLVTQSITLQHLRTTVKGCVINWTSDSATW